MHHHKSPFISLSRAEIDTPESNLTRIDSKTVLVLGLFVIQNNGFLSS